MWETIICCSRDKYYKCVRTRHRVTWKLSICRSTTLILAGGDNWGNNLVGVVFKSLVWSSFLTLRAFNQDHNQSTSVLGLKKTRLDHLGPVYIGFFRS
ncbi:hypothetical protein BYT27DRAFT_7089815 [Phlegmacium glaucopus]|nr:hypothetical protein BYT27DRAFT_7089815 [Phlegmacium glaucopus]